MYIPFLTWGWDEGRRNYKTGLAFLWDMRQRIDRPPDTASLRGPGDGQFRSYEKKPSFLSNRVIKGLHNVVNATRYTVLETKIASHTFVFRCKVFVLCTICGVFPIS
jgi:hypothetical protein